MWPSSGFMGYQYIYLAIFIAGTIAQSGSPPQPVKSEEFEFVVVGSGPGGGSVGANLARRGYSVLIIEAGDDHGADRLQILPSFSTWVAEDHDMSWSFFVEHFDDPEVAHMDSKYTWELTNGSYYLGPDPPEDAKPLGILYPRSGTLGGCGNHNAMNLALPPDNDWDAIANVTGDDSWLATNMRTYFERLERCYYVPEGTAGHGFDGWLGSNQNLLSLVSPDSGYIDVVAAAMTVIGDAENPHKEEVLELLSRDVNRADPERYEHEGVYNLPLHVDGQRRRSSTQTYIRDTVNARHENGSQMYPLTVRTSTLATKILINDTDSGPRAAGVEYLAAPALYKADERYDGTQVGVPGIAYAIREVIVAGGVFNTPQLLKLSGIGPREELESFDIPVKVELSAVGTNMQDNYEGGYETLASADFVNIFENCTTLSPGDPCLSEFWESGAGPYTQGAAPVAMLIRSNQSENEDTDLFFFGGGGSIFRGYYPGFSKARAPLSTWWWSIVKMQPKNRAGTVKLRSADPQDTPIIHFHSFSEARESELIALAYGVEVARNISAAVTSNFAPFNETAPGYENELESIMTETWGHHATCSCPIGVDNTTSCVDSQFRVHGVQGLRIVDASVFPRTPGGFPILPTFMLGEKATDLIVEAAQD